MLYKRKRIFRAFYLEKNNIFYYIEKKEYMIKEWSNIEEKLIIYKERLFLVIGALKKKREQSKLNYKFWDVISIILC